MKRTLTSNKRDVIKIKSFSFVNKINKKVYFNIQCSFMSGRTEIVSSVHECSECFSQARPYDYLR